MAEILVIDDDVFFQKFLSGLLAKTGQAVTTAGTMAEAEAKAGASDFDLVFLDVRLPDGSGLDLLPRLRALPSEPEVVIITGAGDPDGAELAIRSGAWDYIEKTASQDALRLACLRALTFREKKQEALPLKRAGIVGHSAKLESCLRQMARVARSSANVLLLGETGTGKELFARAIHENSPRAAKEFVIVDCAALQETIMGSELFGHKKGAFTGAMLDKAGLLARAHGGTLFLDEVSELSLEMQKSFLRLLESRTYRPLGDNREIPVDFRLVCASNRDLAAMVADNLFREDLFYRLRSATIHLAPLREMREDLAELTEHYLSRICRAGNLPPKFLAPELLELFGDYEWPGNVRELVHVLDALVAAAPLDAELLPTHLPRDLRVHFVRSKVARSRQEYQPAPPPAPAAATADPAPAAVAGVGAGSVPVSLDWNEFKKSAHDQVERAYLTQLIQASDGDIRSAMNHSGLSQSRLYGLLRKHGLAIGR